VLSDRIEGLEARSLITRTELPPPASVAVIQLTALGETLRPVVTALTRFGIQLLGPPEPDDQFEPSWLRLGLPAVACSTPTPSLSFAVTIEDSGRDVVMEIRGGKQGTSIRDVSEGEIPETDVQIRGNGMVVMGLASGALDAVEALNNGQVEVSGAKADYAKFAQLFDFSPPSSAQSASI